MATVYCANCIYCYVKGGVYYCGCTVSNYYNGSVSPNAEKSCIYHKSK